MGKERITYFTRAENDYLFIKDDYENGKVGEIMCYVMQNDTALKADGYYFSARYPGDDAILVDRDDVNACWAATNTVRDAVCRYIHQEHIAKDVLREISAFD